MIALPPRITTLTAGGCLAKSAIGHSEISLLELPYDLTPGATLRLFNHQVIQQIHQLATGLLHRINVEQDL